MFFASVSSSSHSYSASSSRPMFSYSQARISSGTTHHHPQNTTPSHTLPSCPPPVHATATHDEVPVDTVDKLKAETVGTDPAPSPTGESVPPPYAPYGHKVVEVEQGVYAVEEPPTLARALFFYGFLFFPFWFAGIYIMFTPLRPTPDWEAGKTEDEKKHLLQVLRKTEKKWARRCLIALLGLAVIVTVLIIMIKYGILAYM